MKIIETNQTLNLAQSGLKAGDEITIICVGGGAGGYAGDGYKNEATGRYGGNGGNAGYGGDPGNSGNTEYACGGGGGGAGAGYGAGGGGGGGASYNNASYVWPGGAGGGAGEYKMISHYLNATTVNSISVTIGAGGTGGTIYRNSNVTRKAPTNGGVTSFGSILSANGGMIGHGGPGGADSDRTGGGGGGGAGGYLLPIKMYGGSGGAGGKGAVFNMNISTNNTHVTIFHPDRSPVELGGGGGAGGYYVIKNVVGEKEQASRYGGIGGTGAYGDPTQGGQGVMSKGSGVVVILW